MHEITIAKQIIGQAEKHGNVKAITIEVGDLAHLPAEDLNKVLSELTHWKININRKRSKVKCDCGYLGEPKILERCHDLTLFTCPKCGSIPKVISGNEIILKEVRS